MAAEQIQALAHFTLTDMFWVAVCSTAVSPWMKGYHEGPGVCQVWVLDVREQEGGRGRRGEGGEEGGRGGGHSPIVLGILAACCWQPLRCLVLSVCNLPEPPSSVVDV